MSQETSRSACPTCQGKKVIDGVCETSGEWQGSNNQDGQICTPDQACPTCKGTGYIED